eukprot:504766-Pelagomonas_calceolata.AAC.4
MGKAAGSSFHALYMDGMQRHAPHSSVVVIRVARGAGLQPENLADRLLVLDAHIRQRNPQLATLADDPQINPVLAEQASATINTLNEDCLARMHIIKPHSSMQLLAGLLSLPRLLAQCQVRLCWV